MAARLVAKINKFWANLPLRTKALALLTVPLPVAIVVSLALYGAHRGEQDDRAQIQRAWDVRSDIHRTTLVLLNAEAAVLEFVMQGDRTLLQPYFQSKELLPGVAAHFDALVQAERAQRRVWGEVRSLTNQEFELLDALSETRPV